MDISIIIPTHNRANALQGCLEAVAIAVNNVSNKTIELVVVNNASTDNTAEVLEKWAKDQKFAVQIVFEERAGTSYARNSGAHAAKGEILAFTDDDCQPKPDYYIDLIQHYDSDDEPVMRSGCVLLGNPEDLPLTIKSYSEVTSWKKPMSPDQEGRLLGGTLIGCNMVMPKIAFDTIGGFDTDLGPGTPVLAGEDTDYFYRAYLAGIKMEAVPNMSVDHYHGRKTLEQRAKLLKNYAIGNGALAAKYLSIYPNFSRHLYWQLKTAVKSLFQFRNRPNYYIHPVLESLFLWRGFMLYLLNKLKPSGSKPD